MVIIIIWCNIHTGCTFDPGATTSTSKIRIARTSVRKLKNLFYDYDRSLEQKICHHNNTSTSTPHVDNGQHNPLTPLPLTCAPHQQQQETLPHTLKALTDQGSYLRHHNSHHKPHTHRSPSPLNAPFAFALNVRNKALFPSPTNKALFPSPTNEALFHPTSTLL